MMDAESLRNILYNQSTSRHKPAWVYKIAIELDSQSPDHKHQNGLPQLLKLQQLACKNGP
jgi:hypothetical protein